MHGWWARQRFFVTQNAVFKAQGVIFGKGVFHRHCEIAGKAVLAVRRKSFKRYAVFGFAFAFDFPRGKAESAAAVESPISLIVRCFVFFAVYFEFGVSYSVCNSAHNKPLVAQIGVGVIFRVVKPKHHITEGTAFIGHENRLNSGTECLNRNMRAVFVCDCVKKNFFAARKLSE